MGAMWRLVAPILWLLARQGAGDDDYSFDTLPGIDRYTRFDRMPTPGDTDRVILAAGDVKCPVCQVILTDVLGHMGSKKFATEPIMEALEADDVDDTKLDHTWSQKEQQVFLKKRGCNKLFKDNFLEKGHTVVGCLKVQEGQDIDSMAPYEKARWTCYNYTGHIPNRTELNTYTLAHEAIHHACEYTIGSHRDAIAKYVAAEWKKASADRSRPNMTIEAIVERACRLKGQCTKRKPSESVAARQKRAEEEFKGQGQDTLDSYLKKKKEEEKAEKAEKKRRKEEKAKLKAEQAAGAASASTDL